MPAKLSYRNKQGNVMVAALSEGGGTLGRGERSTIRISDATVSNMHCRFLLLQGQWHVEDLGSRTGLTVRQLLEGIARLELGGLVRQSAAGEVERAVLR